MNISSQIQDRGSQTLGPRSGSTIVEENWKSKRPGYSKQIEASLNKHGHLRFSQMGLSRGIERLDAEWPAGDSARSQTGFSPKRMFSEATLDADRLLRSTHRSWGEPVIPIHLLTAYDAVKLRLQGFRDRAHLARTHCNFVD